MPTILKEVMCEDGSIMVVEEQTEEEPTTTDTDNPSEKQNTEANDPAPQPDLCNENSLSSKTDEPLNSDNSTVNPIETIELDNKENEIQTEAEEKGEEFSVGSPVPMSVNESGEVNLSDARFQCPECDKRLFRSDYLRMHLNLHFNGQVAKAVCVFCGDQFQSSKDLKIHKELKHSKYCCTTCHRRFNDNYALRIHRLKFCKRCSKCGITFQNNSDLKKHMDSHENKKPGRPKSGKDKKENEIQHEVH